MLVSLHGLLLAYYNYLTFYLETIMIIQVLLLLSTYMQGNQSLYDVAVVKYSVPLSTFNDNGIVFIIRIFSEQLS